MRFRRFQSQLLVFFLGLFTVVQALGFAMTHQLSERDAYRRIAESLSVAGGVLGRQLADRNTRLLEAGRLLAGDFAFKTAWSTREPSTIHSMLENHRRRIGADWMALVDLDDRTAADTLAPDQIDQPFPHIGLLDRAYESEGAEASGIVFHHDTALQVIVLPLMMPFHDAWILIGFELDDAFVEPLQAIVRADISLLRTDREPPDLHASTLPEQVRESLKHGVRLHHLVTAPQAIQLGQDTYLSLAVALDPLNRAPLYALMQRDMDEVLAPYRRLQTWLGVLFLLGVLATATGSALLARGVTGPLRTLAASAARIAAGNYQQHVTSTRRDELGQLTEAFNGMAQGLAERDRVRDLLGKVVSAEVAHELLSRETTLGGEEREVTVVFVDCHGFTSFAENRPPAEVLAQLNETLTALTRCIEAEAGIVDKYIGDAVMAVFGAPMAQPDAPRRAVRAALAMTAVMDTWAGALRVGIGINSGPVVAGNMGSVSRLNYTVIGDNVNLASRLESLTRHYGVPVLVSEATRATAPEFTYREVDRVQVKGRVRPVVLYEPLAAPPPAEYIELHERALGAFRVRRFTEARRLFAELETRWPSGLYALYQARCEHFAQNPPPPDWDGVHRFGNKDG